MLLIRAISLFSGAGGLSLGLHQAGFEHVLLNDIEKDPCLTLKHNMPLWNVIQSDIKDLDFAGYTGVDLVDGSFSCQSFSYAGKKLGFEDTRGTLFRELARCLIEVRPKMFVSENVRGLINHDSGNTFSVILNVFDEIGYRVKWKLLSAENYGVPQKRERVFIVGVRDDIDEEYSFPEPDSRTLTVRDAIGDYPESQGCFYSDKKSKVMELVPEGGCWRDLPIELQKSYMKKSFFNGGGRTGIARRLSWDKPSLTVLTSPSQKMTDRCHPQFTRPLNIRESARIQTFPDDWTFKGSISSQYKQIGKAVPVEMARRVGVTIMETLKKTNKEKN